MEKQRIGVLTSGGDAPGMNAAIRAVVRTASRQGMECVGIRRGWHGLINSDFVRLDTASVSHTIDKGGTLLYTARSEEFLSPSGREKALATCKLLGLDGLVAIGGDGTFRGALALSRQAAEEHSPLQVVGIPATIDNDIGCTHYTIGFDTACNTAIACIDKLRDTMQSLERCSLVEVMGRHAGYLALYVGIAVGATAVLIPEHEVDFERDIADKIRRARLSGSTHYMIVVAEGAGSAMDYANRIRQEIGIAPRVTVLGHIQREMMVVMSHVATPSALRMKNPNPLPEGLAAYCEEQIDHLTAQMKETSYFVLPGGTPVAAHVQWARTVARRAERRLWTLNKQDEVPPCLLQFINRLSDLLFVMARYEMFSQGEAEERWKNFLYKRRK